MMSCPHCDYSVAPDRICTTTKHFTAHSFQCVRCLYRTETKASWSEAEAAWNKSSVDADSALMEGDHNNG